VTLRAASRTLAREGGTGPVGVMAASTARRGQYHHAVSVRSRRQAPTPALLQARASRCSTNPPCNARRARRSLAARRAQGRSVALVANLGAASRWEVSSGFMIPRVSCRLPASRSLAANAQAGAPAPWRWPRAPESRGSTSGHALRSRTKAQADRALARRTEKQAFAGVIGTLGTGPSRFIPGRVLVRVARASISSGWR
jgi:hypothetical protein